MRSPPVPVLMAFGVLAAVLVAVATLMLVDAGMLSSRRAPSRPRAPEVASASSAAWACPLPLEPLAVSRSGIPGRGTDGWSGPSDRRPQPEIADAEGALSDIRLQLSPEFLEHFQSATFESATVMEGENTYSLEFVARYYRVEWRLLDDALELRDFPVGARIVLQGVVVLNEGEATRGHCMAPLVLEVRAGMAVQPVRQPAIELGRKWADTSAACLSGCAQAWVPFGRMAWATPGRHEVIAFGGYSEGQTLRLSLEVTQDNGGWVPELESYCHSLLYVPIPYGRGRDPNAP